MMILTTGDENVEKFANKYHIDYQLFTCEWKKYGKNAIKERNDKILSNVDGVLYFDDGDESNKMLYASAKSKGVKCKTVHLNTSNMFA